MAAQASLAGYVAAKPKLKCRHVTLSWGAEDQTNRGWLLRFYLHDSVTITYHKVVQAILSVFHL